jgi:hypothetical protein
MIQPQRSLLPPILSPGGREGGRKKTSRTIVNATDHQRKKFGIAGDGKAFAGVGGHVVVGIVA